MENLTQVNLKKEALKNGLIWGAINVVIFLVVWYAAPSLMSSYWYGFVVLILGIVLAVFFCKDLRTKAGGYWTFSEALWPIAAMFIMNVFTVAVFTYIFGKYIDPTYGPKMIQATMESSEKMFSSMGMDQSTVDEALSKMEADLQKQFNPGISDFVKSFGLMAIFYFIGALIFAAIFKKVNPNPFLEVEEQ